MPVYKLTKVSGDRGVGDLTDMIIVANNVRRLLEIASDETKNNHRENFFDNRWKIEEVDLTKEAVLLTYE